MGLFDKLLKVICCSSKTVIDIVNDTKHKTVEGKIIEVYVDGKLIDNYDSAVTIMVNGDVGIIDNTSGDINVSGNCGDVTTHSGDVATTNTSRVKTSSGNVSVGTIVSGVIETSSGNINIKNCKNSKDVSCKTITGNISL